MEVWIPGGVEGSVLSVHSRALVFHGEIYTLGELWGHVLRSIWSRSTNFVTWLFFELCSAIN